MDNLLKDYYTSKAALDILTEELDEKKKIIIEHLKTIPDNKTGIDEAKFSLRLTPTYQFTQAVEDKAKFVEVAKQALKEVQAEEIKSGAAKVVKTTEILVMTKNK